jgi:hypothetical protein
VSLEREQQQFFNRSVEIFENEFEFVIVGSEEHGGRIRGWQSHP